MIVKIFKMIMMSKRHFIVTELQFTLKNPRQKNLAAHSETSQTYKMEFIAKIANALQPLNIFKKRPILDV